MKAILSKSLFPVLSLLFLAAILFSCFGSDDEGEEEPALGKVSFYSDDLTHCNGLSVNLNGLELFLTQDHTEETIFCDAYGAANFSLPPGEYTYTAKCGDSSWERQITITSNECKLEKINIDVNYPNILIGDWQMVIFDDNIPVGEEASTYSESCPSILMWREAESGSYHFTEDTFTFVWNNHITQTNIDFDPSTCEIFGDYPDTQHEGTQTGHGTYQYHINLEGIELHYIESEIPGEVVPLEFLSSTRIRIYDQEFVKL